MSLVNISQSAALADTSSNRVSIIDCAASSLPYRQDNTQQELIKQTSAAASNQTKPNRNGILELEIIQKMLQRILTETSTSKTQLSEALGITLRQLQRLCMAKPSPGLVRAINFSLVKLYCKTRFRSKTTSQELKSACGEVLREQGA